MEKKVKIYIFSGIVTLLVIFSVTFQLFHAESFESRLARAMGMINQLQSSVLQTNISSSNIDFLESVYQDSLKRVESIKKFREEDKKKLIQRVQETGQAGNGPNGLTQIGEDIISLSTQKVDDFDTNIDTRIGNIGTLTEDQKTQIKKLAKSINTLTNDIRLTSQFINWYEEMRPTICQTTDPTNNPTLKGVLTFKFNTALPSLTDTCSADGASVVQYRCLGMQYRDDGDHKQTIACPDGCSDGACLPKKPNTTTVGGQACSIGNFVGKFLFSKGSKNYTIVDQTGATNTGETNLIITDANDKNYRKIIGSIGSTSSGLDAITLNDKIYISAHSFSGSIGTVGRGKNTVTVLDMNLDRVIRKIDLKTDERVVSWMKSYAINNKIYIAGWSGPSANMSPDTNEIAVLDSKTDEIIKYIAVGRSTDFIGSAGDKLYSIDNVSGTISIIDTKDDSVKKTLPSNTGGYSFKQVGTNIYIINSIINTNGSVTVLDTNTDTITATITVVKGPRYYIFSDTKLYVGNVTSGSENASISVINLKNNSVIKTLTGFRTPISSAIVGNKIYIADTGTGKEGISIIDTTTDTIIKNIPLKYITNITAVDNYVYIARRDDVGSLYTGLGDISVIDTVTDTIIATIPTEQPTSIIGTINGKLYLSPFIVIDTTVKNPDNTCNNPQKPSLSDIQSSPAITVAEIKWRTDRATNTVIRYGNTTAYESNSSENIFTKEHSLFLRNLTPLTTYHFQITSTDRSGNIVTSGDNTFTTGHPGIITGLGTREISDPVVIGTNLYTNNGDGNTVNIINTLDNSVSRIYPPNIQGAFFKTAVSNKIYLVLNGIVSVIDTITNKVIKTSEANLVETSTSASVIGTKIFFHAQTFKSIVYDTKTDTVVTKIPIPGYPINSITVGSNIYLATWGITNTQLGYNVFKINVINGINNTLTSSITVGNKPTGLATIGNKLYVTNSGDNSVSVIDTTNNSVIKTIPVGTGPDKAYILGSKLYVNNIGSKNISVINTTNDIVTNTIQLSGAPNSASIAGNKLYVNNANENTVSIIDGSSDKISGIITLPDNTYPKISITIGNNIYLNGSRGTIIVIDSLTDKILGANDSGIPKISNIESIAADKSIIISWATDQDTSSKITLKGCAASKYQGISAGYVGKILEDGGKTHKVIFDGLPSDTIHSFQIQSTNNIGISTYSDIKETTTSNLLPPIISGLNVQKETIGKTSAVISWKTDKPSNSIIEYGIDSNYGLSQKDDTLVQMDTLTGGYKHAIVLQDLLPGSTYHFSAGSTSSSGVVVKSTDMSFSTPDSCSIVMAGPIPNSSTYSMGIPGGLNGNDNIYGDNIYIGLSQEKSIVVFNTIKNTIIAKIKLESYPKESRMVNKKIYFVGRNQTTSSEMIVIDPETNTVQKRVPINGYISGVIGTNIYITNYSTLFIFDTTTDTLKTVNGAPGGTEFISVNKKLYVQGSDAINIIDTSTNALLKKLTITYANKPNMIGSKIYTTTNNDKEIYVIDTNTDTISKTIPLGIYGDISTINGTKIYYVNHSNSNKIAILDTVTETVETVNFGTNATIVSGISVGSNIYFSAQDNKGVFIFDTTKNTFSVLKNIEGLFIAGLAGKNLYLGTENTIKILSTETNTLINTCENPPAGS